MRNLARRQVRAHQLLDRARTIAVVGPVTARDEATVDYLRRVGYDVVVVPSGTLADVPGPVDLVLVLGAPADMPGLLQGAADKRVDGVWFIEDASGRAALKRARQLSLTVIVRGTASRRLGRANTADSTVVPTGWTEAGGGGSHGGGGGRGGDRREEDGAIWKTRTAPGGCPGAVGRRSRAAARAIDYIKACAGGDADL